MLIDRHNYEEFFILYMDNELSAEDRYQVEGFIQKNPDLGEEMDVLLQYKMVPDTTVIFQGKEEMMRSSDITSVNLANAEEWLILYMDNELTTDQRNHFENFLANNPILQSELNTFQRVQLKPEAIIFEDKESLYRRDEKIRPIIWWRVAIAAAIVIGISISAAVVLNQKPAGTNDKGQVAKTTTPSKVNVIVPVIDQGKKNEIVPLNNDDQKTLAQTPSANHNIIPQQNNISRKNHSSDNNVKDEKASPDLALVNDNDQKPSNNLPKPLNNINAIDNVVKNPIALSSPEFKASGKPLTSNNVTRENIQPSYTSDGGIASTNDNNTLEQSGGKKSKLRGFFRKITRTFEKNTNSNATDADDKVLIAGLTVKL